MDIEFIQEQLDNLATWGGAVEDIWGAIEDLFGVDGEDGALANLSSTFVEDAPEGDNGGDAGNGGDAEAENGDS